MLPHEFREACVEAKVGEGRLVEDMFHGGQEDKNGDVKKALVEDDEVEAALLTPLSLSPAPACSSRTLQTISSSASSPTLTGGCEAVMTWLGELSRVLEEI